MARIGVVALVVLAVLGAAAWFLFLRPPVSVASAIDATVTVECTASTGLDEEACRGVGDTTLEAGAPSTTFELEDVVRIRVDRGPFGGECRFEWFLGRYPDDAAWTETGPCGVSSSD